MVEYQQVLMENSVDDSHGARVLIHQEIPRGTVSRNFFRAILALDSPRLKCDLSSCYSLTEERIHPDWRGYRHPRSSLDETQ